MLLVRNNCVGYDCVSECVRMQGSVILLPLVRVKNVLRKQF